MPLNIDRIRQLAEEDDDEIPEMTAEQANSVLRLLTSSDQPTEADQ